MNNSSEISRNETALLECELPDWYWTAANGAQRACYEVLTSAYIVVCLPGFLFTLAVLQRQMTAEKAYLYQVFLTACRTAETVSVVQVVYTFSWSGIEARGMPWFQRSYWLMWIAARLSLPLVQFTTFATLYLSLAMCIDRLFAILQPVRYRCIDQRRHQYVALVVCLAIALLASVHNGWLFTLSETSDDDLDDGEFREYRIEPDLPFHRSYLGHSATHMAGFLRIFGLSALIGCNMILIRSFRLRTLRVAAMTAASSRDESRRNRERTLFLLTVCQSFFGACVHLAELIFYTGTVAIAQFSCYHALSGPALNMFIELVTMADVVSPFIICDKMRQSAARIFRHSSYYTGD